MCFRLISVIGLGLLLANRLLTLEEGTYTSMFIRVTLPRSTIDIVK